MGDPAAPTHDRPGATAARAHRSAPPSEPIRPDGLRPPSLRHLLASAGLPHEVVAGSGLGLEIFVSRVEEAFRGLFVDSPLPMWVLDPESDHFVAVNRAAAATYGYDVEEFSGLPVGAVCAARASGERSGERDDGSGEPDAARHRTKDGREIEVEVTRRCVELFGRRLALEWIVDVTHRNRLERELREGSLRDPVTGGASRLLFLERVSHALARMRRRQSGVAVLVADIDCFSDVNSSLGYAGGDSLLQAVAERLTATVRPGDSVARLVGDEFGVLLEDISEPGQAHDAARRIRERFATPVETACGPLRVELSIGLVTAATPGASAAELVRDAALAMHAARSGGRERVVEFAPAMDASATERLHLAQNLRRAVSGDELRVLYQPLIAIAGRGVVGCEVLVRWQHPTRGLVPPDAFIPLAEETGEIRAIDTWVLRTACFQVAEWRRDGFGDIVLAVNCSGRNLGQSELVERIRSALRDSGLPPHRLEVEITESVAVAQSAEALDELRQLRRMGVTIAIDDFGTGYSSLSKLATFPVDRVKIDRAFVASIRSAADDAPLVAAMIALAHRLGLAVTAEGVETEDQLAFLAGSGCDLIQGYLISPPVSAERFRQLLQTNRARADDGIG